MQKKQIKKIAIISGGELSPLTDIDKADFVIACDKGLSYALNSGVRVDLFVGDRDSLTVPVPSGPETLDLPTEKDDTDTLAAIKHALFLGARELTVYCACGGRLDHFLANVQAAAFAAKSGATVKIVDFNCEGWVLPVGKYAFKQKAGYSFSVLALTDECLGVCLSGAKYSLKNSVLKNVYPLGVSNEWAQSEITLSFESGVLAVLTCKL